MGDIQDMTPLSDGPIPPPTSTNRSKYTFDAQSRVVRVDLTEDSIVDDVDKRYLLNLFERPDVTVVIRGLASGLQSHLWSTPYLAERCGHLMCHSLHRYVWDELKNAYVEMEKAEDARISMTIGDYVRYLNVWTDAMRCRAAGRTSPSVFRVTSISGSAVNISLVDEAIYLTEMDLSRYLPECARNLTRNFKLDVFPGGGNCALQFVPFEGRPSMGPKLHIGPPGSLTHFHRDGHGTVDSGYQCLTGRNQVVILRRLSEKNKKHAMEILEGARFQPSTGPVAGSRADSGAMRGDNFVAVVEGEGEGAIREGGGYVEGTVGEGLDPVPHLAGEEVLWPEEEQIEELRKLNFSPSVFTLEAGDFVHINKGRPYALRKLEPLAQGDRGSVCVSVSWNWVFTGVTEKGCRDELGSALECAEINRGEGVESLSPVESCLTQAVRAAAAGAVAHASLSSSAHSASNPAFYEPSPSVPGVGSATVSSGPEQPSLSSISTSTTTSAPPSLRFCQGHSTRFSTPVECIAGLAESAAGATAPLGGGSSLPRKQKSHIKPILEPALTSSTSSNRQNRDGVGSRGSGVTGLGTWVTPRSPGGDCIGTLISGSCGSGSGSGNRGSGSCGESSEVERAAAGVGAGGSGEEILERILLEVLTPLVWMLLKRQADEVEQLDDSQVVGLSVGKNGEAVRVMEQPVLDAVSGSVIDTNIGVHEQRINPFSLEGFKCEACKTDLFNSYMHCFGCESLLGKDHNICLACHAACRNAFSNSSGRCSNRVHRECNNTQTECQRLKKALNFSKKGTWQRSNCGCKEMDCKNCHLCVECACDCHQHFQLRYRFEAADSMSKFAKWAQAMSSNFVGDRSFSNLLDAQAEAGARARGLGSISASSAQVEAGCIPGAGGSTQITRVTSTESVIRTEAEKGPWHGDGDGEVGLLAALLATEGKQAGKPGMLKAFSEVIQKVVAIMEKTEPTEVVRVVMEIGAMLAARAAEAADGGDELSGVSSPSARLPKASCSEPTLSFSEQGQGGGGCVDQGCESKECEGQEEGGCKSRRVCEGMDVAIEGEAIESSRSVEDKGMDVLKGTGAPAVVEGKKGKRVRKRSWKIEERDMEHDDGTTLHNARTGKMNKMKLG